MKLSSLSIFISLAIHAALAAPEIKRASSDPILINPPGFPSLPSSRTGSRITPQVATTLNLNDIQGDVLIGMRKVKELFFFFSIKDAATFKSKLGSDIHSLVTNTNQILPGSSNVPVTAVNVAFSNTGLLALNVTDDLLDPDFVSGQFAEASSLGDAGTSNWVPGFAGTNIHGVFLLAANDVQDIDTQLANIQQILGDSITEIYRLSGAARPGDEEGHEHFGFLDGISNPAVQGFDDGSRPQPAAIASGRFILGTDGDTVSGRPDWTTGGSFLVFRQLQQKVPEFNKYVEDNALNVPGLSQQENTDLFGARLIGRWKSGAPIDLAPLRDDPALGADSQRNNNFNYDHPEIPGFNVKSNQTLCPFSAHLRKTRPRATLGAETGAGDDHHIIRSGIPYGPEVTDAETSSNQSSTDPSLERGLAFVAYQSNIASGFKFIQQSWIDNAQFPSPIAGITGNTTGIDPIIGRVAGSATDAPRVITGTDPLDTNKAFTIDSEFVISRGGEYFFSPPISALSGRLST
ncbi:fungal peroxidase [Dendrothele bispora CBS 962.96]|uniref:Fungal peroxidase n=1 Tax=Dendrothele bispora (strain CBS 962.96) TaxID=1314807 RepID=A0A4S8LHI3_DENBC|nr:fungal peroxidase [Dendrothele bispora CBS 962.96]